MKDKVTTDANHKPIIANYMVDILNYHDGMVCRLPIVSQCSSLIRETSLILTSYVWIQLSVRHYIDVIVSTMASQITSLTVVYSTVYSDADQRKHQSSASLAFVWGIHRDRWIPRTKGQLRGKCLHLMTSSWITPLSDSRVRNPSPPGQNGRHFADDIFLKCIFVNEKFCILIKISLKFVPKGQFDKNPALVQIKA